MTNDTKSTFEVVAEERLLEADRLKKAWFDHVFASLEKLGRRVEKLSSELYAAKDALYKDIVDAKEVLRSELAVLKSEHNSDLEKLEKRIEKSIDSINKSIESLSVQKVKDELKKDVEDLGKEINKELTKIKDDRVAPLTTEVTKLKVKISVWGVLGGIVGAAIVAGVLEWFIPAIFKALTVIK